MTIPATGAAQQQGMPSWLKWLLGGGAAAAGLGAGRMGAGNWDWLLGNQGSTEQVSNFSPGQQSIFNQSLGQFGQGGGAGGALDYYNQLLQGGPEAFAAYEAPAMRQFNEQIVPGLAERFSAVGGQRSSAFPQALSQAGADLSERLAAQRSHLQGQASQGIMQYLNQLLGTKSFENVRHEASPGLLGHAAGGLGQFFGSKLFG